jgi:hypothetical protein
MLRNIPEERRYYSIVGSTSKFRIIYNSQSQQHGFHYHKLRTKFRKSDKIFRKFQEI